MSNKLQASLFKETDGEGQDGSSDCTALNRPAPRLAALGSAVCARQACQGRFSPYRPFQTFCSRECQRRDWAESHPRKGTSEEKRAEAKAARDVGMASAARHYDAELGVARRVALEVIGRLGAGIISHVREECDRLGLDLDWAANWPGSLFHASPWFQATGRRVTAFHPTSNARKVNEYRLTDEGRRALREMGR